MHTPIPEFTRETIITVFQALTSVDTGLKQYFSDYMTSSYGNDISESLDYIDIGMIGRYVVDKFKAQQIEFFPSFFLKAETILSNCDTYVDQLIVVGLFESIQHIGGPGIDYYFSFDKWLQPLSKSKWDNLIDAWEGQEWRTRKSI